MHSVRLLTRDAVGAGQIVASATKLLKERASNPIEVGYESHKDP